MNKIHTVLYIAGGYFQGTNLDIFSINTTEMWTVTSWKYRYYDNGCTTKNKKKLIYKK